MDVYNPEDFGIVLGFAMQTARWNWIQSGTWIYVGPGEHTVVFDITNFKEEDKQSIARVLIGGAGEHGSGSFYVDNIRFYR